MLEPVIQAASAANPQKQGDYMQDGLLNCGICRTPKQCRIKFMGNERVVPCMCQCAKEQAAAEEAARRRQEEADRIMRLRNAGIVSQQYRDACFEKDDGKNPDFMKKLRNYAENWEEYKKQKIGLLLYGDTGTGKSYGAACVANYLIERYTPVCMVNLSTVLNYLGGFRREANNEYITNLMQYPLLILDDFGMERQDDNTLEQIFNIIDARSRSNLPLIITTNIPLAAIDNPQDIKYKRIYERIRAMCQPIFAAGPNRRKIQMEEKAKIAVKLLRGG